MRYAALKLGAVRTGRNDFGRPVYSLAQNLRLAARTAQSNMLIAITLICRSPLFNARIRVLCRPWPAYRSIIPHGLDDPADRIECKIEWTVSRRVLQETRPAGQGLTTFLA